MISIHQLLASRVAHKASINEDFQIATISQTGNRYQITPIHFSDAKPLSIDQLEMLSDLLNKGQLALFSETTKVLLVNNAIAKGIDKGPLSITYKKVENVKQNLFSPSQIDEIENVSFEALSDEDYTSLKIVVNELTADTQIPNAVNEEKKATAKASANQRAFKPSSNRSAKRSKSNATSENLAFKSNPQNSSSPSAASKKSVSRKLKEQSDAKAEKNKRIKKEWREYEQQQNNAVTEAKKKERTTSKA